MTWHCFCGEILRGWLDLQNHLRLMHPDVDREVEWPTTLEWPTTPAT
jgi:hypothetical protein